MKRPVDLLYVNVKCEIVVISSYVITIRLKSETENSFVSKV